MAVTGQTDSMYQRNRRLLRFTCVDEDSPLDPKPNRNLSGYTAKFALARFDVNGNPVRTNPLIDLSSAGVQVVITGVDNHIIEVTLVEANTTAIFPGDYYFEVEIFDSTPSSLVVSTGTLTILANIINA